jgi:hypothetical protein
LRIGFSFDQTTLSSAWSDMVSLIEPDGFSRSAVKAAISSSIPAMRGVMVWS